jgi:hypothetical protein
MANVTKGRTFTSGETVTPAKLNDVVDLATVTNIQTADIADGQVTQAKLASNVTTTGPAFRAHATTATTGFSTGVQKKVTLDTEDYDTANCFASSRFTPNVAGYYLITGAINWNGVTAGRAEIHKNGVASVAVGSYGAITVGVTISNVSDLIFLNGTTDYVELFGAQFSGTTQDAAPNSNATFFSGFLARAA